MQLTLKAAAKIHQLATNIILFSLALAPILALALHFGILPIELFFCHLFTTWQAHKTTTTIYIGERGGQKQAKVRKSGFVFLVFDYTQRILAAAPVY